MVNAWLLLVIAVLVVACLSLYVNAQRMESDSLLQRSLADEDLSLVEQALETARELVQSQPIFPPALPLVVTPARPEDIHYQAILRLRRSGKSTIQRARELSLPLGAIELLLSLEK